MYNKIFGKQKTFEVNTAEITYKVHYLGNVMTSLLKGTFHHGHSNTYRKLSENVITNDKKEGELFDELDDDEFHGQLDLNETIGSNASSTSSTSASLAGTCRINMSFIDKSVKILWDNHVKHQGHAGIKMKLTLTQGGLRVNTRDHGLTEYYGHRIHLVKSHQLNPKLVVWVYQHVGKNLKSEIRCHAALCEKVKHAKNIEAILTDKLQRTFLEYKREKKRMQNSRLCHTKNGGALMHQMDSNKRKRVMRSVTHQYKPPVQHGMCSAPKLDDVIEEDEDDLFDYNEMLIDDPNRTTNTSPPLTNTVHDDEEDHDECSNANTFHELDSENNSSSPEEDDEDFFAESSSSVDFDYYRRVGLLANATEIDSAKSAENEHAGENNNQQQMILSSSSSASSSSSSSKYLDCVMPKSAGQYLITDKQFVEVSYDYLSDLSKLNSLPTAPSACQNSTNVSNKAPSEINSHFRKNVNISKSFIARSLKPTINANTLIINPFRKRTANISKSFTAFTSRFRPTSTNNDINKNVIDATDSTELGKKLTDLNLSNEASRRQLPQPPAAVSPSSSSSSTTTNPADLVVSASSLSSPTLSTSSYSSSKKIEDDDAQIVISL